MEKKYSLLILDTNNYFYSSFKVEQKKNPSLTSQQLLKKTIQECFLRILRIKNKYLQDEGKLICTFDNPTSKIQVRKLIDPEYKVNRTKEKDGFYRALEFLRVFINNYDSDFYTIQGRKLEGDDLVKPLIEAFLGKGSALLISEDLDWARMMSSEVDWLAKDFVFNQITFKESYKFFPSISTIALHKTFRGDPSDHILAGLPGVPEEKLLELIASFDTIYDIYSNLSKVEKILSASWVNKMKEVNTRQRLYRNFELVSFQNISVEEIQESVVRGKKRIETLQVLSDSLGLDFSDEVLPRKTLGGSGFFKIEEVNRR